MSSQSAEITPTLPAWKPALWGCGQVAVQVYRDIPSLLLLFYMTQLLAIPPAIAGFAIFLPKLLWSSMCDYAVGSWSDRLRRRLPRRRLLLVGALLLPVCLIGLFMPPSAASTTWRAATVSAWLVGYVTVFSLFSVPHLSIGAELASDRRGQSRVMAWRTAFFFVGVMAGAGFAPWLIQSRGGGAPAYHVMSMAMAVICSTALVLAYFGSQETLTHRSPSQTIGKWRALIENRPFLLVLAAFAAQQSGQGAAYATLTYLVVFRHGFAAPFELLSVSVLLTSVSGIALQPLLVRITHSYGSRLTFMVGSVLYSGSLAWMALGPVGSVLSFYCASVALGLSNSITLQSVYTCLSELISEDAARHNGHSNAGFYSSLFVACDKIAFALGGTLLAGALLSLSGFQAGSTQQTPTATLGIALIFALAPASFNALAILLMGLSRRVRAAPRPVLAEGVSFPL